MAFLSLSKADPTSRELLKRAVRARYGMRPIPIEGIGLALAGAIPGPLSLQIKRTVNLIATSNYYWRWEEARKLLFLNQGTTLQVLENGKGYLGKPGELAEMTTPEAIKGSYIMTWSLLVFLVTPLTVQGVTLQSTGDNTFQAFQNRRPDVVATVELWAEDGISVTADCYYPPAGKVVKLNISSQGGIQTFGDFAFPQQIVFTWNGTQRESFNVTGAQPNAQPPQASAPRGSANA